MIKDFRTCLTRKIPGAGEVWETIRAKRKKPLKNSFHTVTLPTGAKRYMVLCANSAVDLIRLIQVDLTHIGHDGILFRQINAAYEELRGKKAKNVFVVPKTTEYIKVCRTQSRVFLNVKLMRCVV